MKWIVIGLIYTIIFVIFLIGGSVSNEKWSSWSYWLANARGGLCFAIFWSFTLYGKKIFKVVLFNLIIILLILVVFMATESRVRGTKMSSFDIYGKLTLLA